MATLSWFSGCECGGPVSGAGGEFNAYSDGGSGAPVHSTNHPRTGAYSLRAFPDGRVRAKSTYASSPTTFVRFGFYLDGGNVAAPVVILAANNSTSSTGNAFHLWVNTNGTLGWGFGNSGETGPIASGANALNINAWNLIEIKFVRDATVGGMEIYLNGVLQVSAFASATTSNTSDTTMTLHFGNDVYQPGTAVSGQEMFFDDMAFGTGGYIGNGGSIAVQGKAGSPTYNAWTKSTGNIDDVWTDTPFDPATFATANVVNDRQTILVDGTALEALVGAADTINAAQVVCVGKIVTSGNFKITRRIGGADTDSGTIFLLTVDTFRPNGVDVDPNGIFVDTRANLASAEMGVICNSTNLTTIEDVWLMVDFAPDLNPDITPGAGALVLTGQSATTQGGGSITPAAGALVLSGQQPSIRPIAPGAGALGLTGYSVDMLRRYVPTGAMVLVGQTPLLRTHLALQVQFDIITPVGDSPLFVLFDIETVPGSEPEPLIVEFDIIEANASPMTVTFDILSGRLVTARLTSDIQGPVAKAILT